MRRNIAVTAIEIAPKLDDLLLSSIARVTGLRSRPVLGIATGRACRIGAIGGSAQRELNRFAPLPTASAAALRSN